MGRTSLTGKIGVRKEEEKKEKNWETDIVVRPPGAWLDEVR